MRDIPTDLPVTDEDWARLVMTKLEQSHWRFSLNDEGQFTVRIGEPPMDAMMALLGQWAPQCEAVLRARGEGMAADETIH